MTDLLDQLGVERVINASGRMTALGVNTLEPATLEAMALASRNYVDIDRLHRAVGAEVARLLGAEDAMVTTGAAAGVALMVAACIAGDDLSRVQALPDPLDAPCDVVIQAGHQVNFGASITQMIALGGGRCVGIGAVNSVRETHLASALGPSVAAFVFVQSHHAVQKGMLTLERCTAICRERGVPVLVDAAAEEDLRRYVGLGADLVTFSGGKAIGGPTSGIIAGRADLVEACRAQNNGIGRPMKVGKEALLGLVEALRVYMKRNEATERAVLKERVDRLMTGFEGIQGATATRLADEAGRGIERAALTLGRDCAEALIEHLRRGSPPIYPRGHLLNVGIVAFDPRPLADDDIDTVIERVRAFFHNELPSPSGKVGVDE